MKALKRIVMFFASLLVCGTFAGCASGVPKPEVKEGKFNFSVTYEVDGEVETISGVYVCKFVKATKSIDGQGRKWNAYVEGGEMATTVDLATVEDGVIKLELSLNAFYFMSDPFWDGIEPEPYLWILYNDDIKEATGEFCSEEAEVLEGYGYKIISYYYDAPIENIYR